MEAQPEALTTTRHAQAINARSIKKVAEAKARKKRRTEQALTKIRKKSLALSEKADLSEREKASEMSRAIAQEADAKARAEEDRCRPEIHGRLGRQALAQRQTRRLSDARGF